MTAPQTPKIGLQAQEPPLGDGDDEIGPSRTGGPIAAMCARLGIRNPLLTVSVAAAIGLALVLLTGAALKDGSIFGPTVANWVEAVGSIAAVTAAALIAGHQNRLLRNRETLRLRRMQEASAHLALEAIDISKQSLWTDDLGLQLEGLCTLFQLLAEKALDSGDIALQLVRLERALRTFAFTLKGVTSSDGASMPPELRRAGNLVRRAARPLCLNIRDATVNPWGSSRNGALPSLATDRVSSPLQSLDPHGALTGEGDRGLTVLKGEA